MTAAATTGASGATTATAAKTAAAATTATMAAGGTTAAKTAASGTTATMVAASGTTATSAAAGGTTATSATTGGPAMTQADYGKIGPELAAAYQGKYKGTKVSMFGPFSGEDETKFNNSMKGFKDATGIDIQYQGSKEFEATINVRVEGGSAPDIADFPQPGLAASIAKTGKMVDANKIINPDWLKQNYNQGYIDTATVDGANGKILAGVFQRVNVKGLVWYPKKAFDQAGYKVPQTYDELKSLMDQIVKDGDTPWCIGIESGAATGWVATDWVENYMLRTTSPQNYDKWTKGELPFTDPIVKKAVKLMSDVWLNDKYVYGGRKQIVSTNFGDAPGPMFQNPPKCYLHQQGNFITSFFEKSKPGVKGGVDYDFFYFPPIDPQYGKPLEFAGDLMSAFNDRPEVRAVMQYFSTFDGVRGWVQAGGALSPHKNADLNLYGSVVDKKVAQTLLDASVVRFDGSDLMPGAVGAGTFWKGMTDYVSGSLDLDKAMEVIQAGWANVKK
ncbi:MAG: ABC transporter substrate-binding protein [Herpetosiphon sp.]